MKKILIVDDEAAILDICKRNLELSGYHVATALNALVGLEILSRENIDFIISDLKMPVMDGLAFLQKVKEKWPGIGFMLITGYWISNQLEIEKAQPSLFAVLKKPFEFSELLELVKKYFYDKEHAGAAPD